MKLSFGLLNREDISLGHQCSLNEDWQTLANAKPEIGEPVLDLSFHVSRFEARVQSSNHFPYFHLVHAQNGFTKLQNEAQPFSSSARCQHSHEVRQRVLAAVANI